MAAFDLIIVGRFSGDHQGCRERMDPPAGAGVWRGVAEAVSFGVQRYFSIHRSVRTVRLLARGVIAASIEENFSRVSEHWRPKVIAELNGQEVKLVKFQGEFPWHHHESADEMFLVWRGQMRVELRDRVITLGAGDYCVVPRGVEHRTCADEEACVILFEPAATRNTGNVVDERFTAPDGVRL